MLKLFICVVYYQIAYFMFFFSFFRLMLFSLKLSYMNSFKNIIRETRVVDYYD